MARAAEIAKIIAFIVVGAFLGGAGDVGVAHLVALYGRWKHPNDPSAYSGAIIVILTFPLGVLVGIVGGSLCAVLWAKWRESRNFEGFEVIDKPRGRAER